MLLIFILAAMLSMPYETSFEKLDWKLSGGEGRWERLSKTGERSLSVKGDGQTSNRWEHKLELEPFSTYMLSFYSMKEEASGGCVISGFQGERRYMEELVVSGINRDFSPSTSWSFHRFIFVTPKRLESSNVYLGQWHMKGEVYFDDLKLIPVKLILPDTKPSLGHDERITEGRYVMSSRYGGLFSNYSRALHDFTAGFNTDRWVLDKGRYVTYRHDTKPYTQTSAEVRVTICWYREGRLRLKASRDGENWLEFAEFSNLGEHRAKLPSSLFPSDRVFVKLESTGVLQVSNYTYEAELSGEVPEIEGSTLYLLVERESEELPVELLSLGRPKRGKLTVRPKVENRSSEEKEILFKVLITTPGGETVERSMEFKLNPGSRAIPKLQAVLKEPGEYEVTLTASEGGEEFFRAETSLEVPSLHASNYGELLVTDDRLSIWWCGSTYKVSRDRPLPEARGKQVEISAAGNEYEPFQVVLRPREDLEVELELTPLESEKGRIPRENISIRLVEYVRVKRPTDSFGCVGDWPDPLPPYRGHLKLKKDRNQPLWITVKVPKGCPPGDYTGKLIVKPRGTAPVEVPIGLHVYDFSLSDETHTRTAYGVGVNRLFHGIKTAEQEAKVFEFYMRTFARHRVSPYWPVPSLARPSWEIIGPREEIDVGPLRFVCNRFNGDFFLILSEGERVGSIVCCLTQFERERGSWPNPDFIKEVRFVVKSPERCVVEVTAARTSSSPARRAFEATYRFEFVAGRPWVIVKCSTIKNTDKVRWRLNGFYYLVPPALRGYKAVNTKRYGAWLWPDKGLAFGGVALGEGVGINLWDGHGDIYRSVGRWLEPGEVYEDDGPPVAIFCGPAEDESSLRTLAESVLKETKALLKGELKPEGSISYEHKADMGVKFHNLDAFDEAMRKHLDDFKFNGWNAAGLFRARRVILAYKGATPELRRAYEKAYRLLEEHLSENGWLEEAYFYWFDEPREEDYPFVVEGMELLKRLAPGVKRLLTEQPEPPLHGHVDIWVPVLSAFDPERAKERQRHGEEVWWYVCCGPRAPYPNNFVDHPAICHRIRFWAAEKYGVQGSLYWSTTYWASRGKPRNPWDDPASYSPSGTFWGNGDGFLLYPPRRGEPPKEPVLEPPVDSIRWELIREGLEDREYFFILRELLKEAEGKMREEALAEAKEALKLPDKLVRSPTDFSTDPEELFEARDRVARAIEKLRSLILSR
ncbi:DUF4091 domain-containing protein [Candidatus Poribacteria bacterium]|nr:DUF4091 domain-containing protein [Candidatus Poribacteria bacterium]